MEKINKTIPIRCKGNRYLFHNKLKHFQGNLKEMRKEDAQKLRSLILKHGWIAPVFVWNKNYILDGHGRMLVLGELLKEGYTIDALPVVDIEANTKKEAGEILLAINSHFQKITDEGLYQFLHEMEIEVEILKDFKLPDIDIEKFEISYFGEPEFQNVEYIDDELKQKIVITCLEKDMEEIRQIIGNLCTKFPGMTFYV